MVSDSQLLMNPRTPKMITLNLYKNLNGCAAKLRTRTMKIVWNLGENLLIIHYKRSTKYSISLF